MDDSKKARKFRGLKIAFYLLGLPLFVMAVIVACIPFFGEAPFVGATTSNMFANYIGVITGTGMYGVWLAFAVWIILALIQIIVGNTMKSFRSKAMVVIACALIIMLGSVLVCDIMIEKKVNEVAANAPAGVVVNSYKNQLSYYRTVTSDNKAENNKIQSYTDSLKDRVDAYMKIYNIPYTDQLLNTKAVNGSNTPIYSDYYKLATPDAPADRKLITNEPNSKGHLVIDGVDYGEEFYYLAYTETTMKNGKEETVTDYVWFDSAYRAEGAEFGKGDGAASKIKPVDGVYGKSFYNKSGLLTDGTLTGINTSMQIQKQYYEGYNYLTKNLTDIADLIGYTLVDTDSDELKLAKLVNYSLGLAEAKRVKYYTIDDTKDEKVSKYATNEMMYNYEIIRAAGFSVTGEEVEALISSLGGALGSGLKGIVDAILGIGIVDINSILSGALGKTVVISTDIDAINIEVDGTTYTIDANLTIADLQGALDDLGLTADTIANLVGGLLGTTIDTSGYNPSTWLKELLLDLLSGLYWFSSPVLLPTFDASFVNAAIVTSDPDEITYAKEVAAASAIAKYARALYEGKQMGALRGSVLIGNVGDGLYAGAAGFTELEILQLETDLSYQQKIYPIMAFRDMCIIFAGFVVLFTILYYRACERALDPSYEKAKKVKKEKKAKKEEVVEDEQASTDAVNDNLEENAPNEEILEEIDETPVDQNTEKEDK